MTPKDIHRRRSSKAQIADESLRAKTAPSAGAWAKDPSRSDLPGVDTPTGKRSIKGPSWRVNHESQRVEVKYPDKPDYEERQKLKGKGFRWSPKREAWVRKITSSSMVKAQSLGFERAEDVGTPLTGGQKAQRELERMEKSAERHERKSARARVEAEEHHKDAKRMGEVIPMGQPILVGHHSEKADRRYRERIRKKEEKFVEKYRESKHEKGVSERVKKRAEYMKKNPAYASKKIESLDKEVRLLDRRLETEYDPVYSSSRAEFDEWQDRLRARRKEAIEERAFWAEHLKSLGGVKYSRESIKVGDRVKYRRQWYRVERVNPKSVTLKRQAIDSPVQLHGTFTLKYREIRDHKEKEENTE
jgi:hypothetical protein